jgi:hypothetical protein
LQQCVEHPAQIVDLSVYTDKYPGIRRDAAQVKITHQTKKRTDMAANTFVPKGLPLLSDAALVRTMKEYGKSYAALASSVFPSAARLRRQIGLAMLAIEEELTARGIAAPAVYPDAQSNIYPGVMDQKTSTGNHVKAVA